MCNPKINSHQLGSKTSSERGQNYFHSFNQELQHDFRKILDKQEKLKERKLNQN